MTVQFHFLAKAGALLMGITLSSAVHAQSQSDGTAAILQKVTATIQNHKLAIATLPPSPDED